MEAAKRNATGKTITFITEWAKALSYRGERQRNDRKGPNLAQTVVDVERWTKRIQMISGLSRVE